MKQKKFLIAAVIAGAFVLVGTAFASTFSVTKLVSSTANVKKRLTVGKNNNKGKLLVKGYLRNPVKGKVLQVKDSMKVTKNLRVNGVLQGDNIVSADNLGTGVVTETKIGDGAVTAGKVADDAVTSGKILDSAVTSAKIADDAVTSSKVDMTMDGVVKAGAYVLDGGTVSRQFNNLSTSTISATNASTGTFAVNFGSDVSERYVQVMPLKADSVVIPMIQSISSSTVTVKFYTADGLEDDVDPTGFFINVY